MSNRLRIALTKGRLQDNSVALFERAGLDCSPIKDPGRRLVHSIPNYPLDDVLSKAPDVITYVEHGICDLGIVGKDTIMEQGGSFFEVLDLGFGKCRLCIAGYPGEQGGSVNRATFRVATKYPNIARSYYDSKGQTIEIIELHGSVELGPVIGLSDVILDIVESGSTLRANGLTVLEDICDVSARLVVNRVAMKTKRERIRQIIDGLGALLAVKQEGQA